MHDLAIAFVWYSSRKLIDNNISWEKVSRWHVFWYVYISFARIVSTLGHCGSFGIGGVIIVIVLGNLIFGLVHMAFVISFFTGSTAVNSNAVIFASPFIYDALGPLFWSFSALTAFFGIISLSTGSSKARAAALNIWTVLMFLYTVATIAYGIRIVLGYRNLYEVIPDFITALSSLTSAVAEGVANGFGGKLPEKMRSKIGPNSTLAMIAETLTVGVLIKYIPYPFDYIIFMGYRWDIAAALHVILPGAFALLSCPVVLSIRNYFSSDSKGVVKHRERYEDVPLTYFMFASGAGDGNDDYDDARQDEEDLASTFDGGSSSDERESLISSGNTSSSYSRSS